jgi:hypothetical protein
MFALMRVLRRTINGRNVARIFVPEADVNMGEGT